MYVGESFDMYEVDSGLTKRPSPQCTGWPNSICAVRRTEFKMHDRFYVLLTSRGNVREHDHPGNMATHRGATHRMSAATQKASVSICLLFRDIGYCFVQPSCYMEI